MPAQIQTPTPTPEQIRLNDREQIQYLLGNPPTWMLRYGISVMAGFFALLTGLSYLIRYPDVTEAKIILTTTRPPIRVMAQSGGRIAALLATEQQPVAAGQVLAVLENTARREDVLRLEQWLQSGPEPTAPLPEALQLGDLQAAYSALSQHWKDYRYFSANPGTTARIAVLEQQIAQMQQINANLARQQAIFQEEFVLATKERDRQAQLHREKIISDTDFEKSEAAWLQQKRQIAATEAGMLQNTLQIRQIEGQIRELSQTRSDNRNDKTLALAEDLERLKAAIAAWKQAYLITAPIAGRVSFSAIWSNRQPVAAGAEVLAVIPAPADTLQGADQPVIIGRATVPAANSGKIQPGMRVVIRLDGFPAQQYGALAGTVSNISLLPQENNYLLDISLPDNLTTLYGKTIPFRQEMSGLARIITEERRVMERIFDRMRDLVMSDE